MTAIVERLRAWHTPGEPITGDVQLYLDAADRIEALEAALHKIDDITIDHTAMGIARKALARAKATPAPEQDK